MPEYRQPELAQANRLDTIADTHYALGETAGGNSDGYVRTTIYLATVLFLVGISGHFRVRAARAGQDQRRDRVVASAPYVQGHPAGHQQYQARTRLQQREYGVPGRQQVLEVCPAAPAAACSAATP
jgi:hypothetical protein